MDSDQSMASTQPPSPFSRSRKRGRLVAPAATDDASDGGPLPTNELQEVLLRLPSKTLGRLRGVCRAWRSMLCDPLFVAAHTSRCCHTTDSLLVVAVRHGDENWRVDVNLVDMSTGAVVRRLDGVRRGPQHLCAGGGLLCFVSASGDGVVHVVDPATGATTDHPGQHGRTSCTTSSYTLGHVPATGEHKVLHITDVRGEQSCEVFTIGGRGRSHSHGQRWRPTQQSPPMRVESVPRRRAVVHGVAYFLPSHLNGRHYLAEHDSVAAFDLETEEWRPTLIRGPLSSRLQPEHSGLHGNILDVSLAELNGHLVAVHHNYRDNSMDMYSLTDSAKGEWSRTLSLRLDSVLRGRERTYSSRPVQPVRRDRETVARPLAVMDDGRIALWVAGTNVVRVYDPRTETSKEVVDLGKNCSIVGFYRGSHLGFRGR